MLASAAHQPRQAPGTPDASCSQAPLTPPQLVKPHATTCALRYGSFQPAHHPHPAPPDSLHHRPMKLGWSSGNRPLLQWQGNGTEGREAVAGLARRCWRVVHTLCPRKADGRACASRAGPPVEHDRHRHACSSRPTCNLISGSPPPAGHSAELTLPPSCSLPPSRLRPSH